MRSRQPLATLAVVLTAIWCGWEAWFAAEPQPVAHYLPLAKPQPGPDDWPGWRGPTQQGHGSPAVRAPVNNTSTESWHAAIPGTGHAAACVWGDSVFVTTALPERRSTGLVCLDRNTGRIRWNTELAPATDPVELAAAATPACDGYTVFVPLVTGGELRLVGVSIDGTVRWNQSVAPWSRTEPYASAAVLEGALVIVAVDQSDRWNARSLVAAYHRRSGQMVWRTPRPSGDSNGVPVVAELAGRRQLVLPGKRHITSYDPVTGAELWTCRWSAAQITGSVVCDDNFIYATASHPEAETVCVRADGTGDVTDTHLAWRDRRISGDGPSPTLAGNMLILLKRNGMVFALDKLTGQPLWQRTLRGEFEASPVAIGNRLCCTSREGQTYTIDLQRRGELVAEHTLGDRIVGEPVPIGSHWLFRGERGVTLVAPPASDTFAAEPSAPRKF